MSYTKSIKLWRERNTTDLLDKFFVNFTYCSVKIDNNEARLRDVETVFRGESVLDFTGDKRIITEIENHKKLCKSMLQLCNANKTKLSIDLIKQVHYALMKNCYSKNILLKGERPGEFRKSDYVLELHNTSTYSLNIEENINLLITAINDININENNALQSIGHFLCSFIKVSPFAAGNGVIGRMLINYLLIGNNLPPIIFFYIDKEEYYSALDSFKSTNDINKMVSFLDDQSYKTWIKDYNIKSKSLKDFLE